MPTAHRPLIRVLFVCLGNSCRSILAEALARHDHPDVLLAASAGLQPLGYIVPETLTVLQELGVSTDGLASKELTDVPLMDFDLIVNLTTYNLAPYLPPALPARTLTHPILDPYGNSLATYRQVRDAIRCLLARARDVWRAPWGGNGTPGSLPGGPIMRKEG